MDSKKLLAVIVAYNTDSRTKMTLERLPKERAFDVLVVNDGSTDNTQQFVLNSGVSYVLHEKNRGLGAAIKSGIKYALDNKYYAMVILAGNNKDDPSQIDTVFAPIIREDYDYVQGSRFSKGGRWDNLPFFRFVMVKVHAFFVYLITGFPGSDALNGFRAYKLNIFDDKRINPWQEWLDKYEFESYFHYKVITLGYKVKEVAVSKVYPSDKKQKYSHIRPFVDWWKIIRPYLLLKVGIKK